MGSDSYQNLLKWKNAANIIRYHAIYIYKRPGFEVEALLDPRHEILSAPLLEISSTQVRELVKQKKSIRYLVPDAVKDEIERNSYYRGYPVV
jgi:nicotinate-nucleotide adenylyltransferase